MIGFMPHRGGRPDLLICTAVPFAHGGPPAAPPAQNQLRQRRGGPVTPASCRPQWCPGGSAGSRQLGMASVPRLFPVP